MPNPQTFENSVCLDILYRFHVDYIHKCTFVNKTISDSAFSCTFLVLGQKGSAIGRWQIPGGDVASPSKNVCCRFCVLHKERKYSIKQIWPIEIYFPPCKYEVKYWLLTFRLCCEMLEVMIWRGLCLTCQ